jgi:hypothetical protein
MRCAVKSNRPLVPAGGDARFVGTGYRNVRAVYGKAPLGTGESACPISNGMNFSDGKDDMPGLT